ncbi:MAG: ArsA family ATPase [Tepidisphaeraceae bacterium]|jgi:arsenite/tail-anchored protein-transporting ATPase
MATDATSLPEFLTTPQLRLILFGGKGGVGKTTVSLASAVWLARRRADKRLLVVSTDPAHSLMDCIAGSALPPNLTALEINAAELHARFMAEHGAKFTAIAARGTFLDAQDIDRFLGLSLPGLDELMAYVQMAQWLGENAFDTILVDTAPTGHTLRLMAMPQFLEGWLGAMDALLAKHRFMLRAFGRHKQGDELDQFLIWLGESLRRPSRMMVDALQCRFVPVMLAEAMSVAETTDLVLALDKLSVPHPELIVNRVMPMDEGIVYAEARARQHRLLRQLPPALQSLRAWVFPQHGAEIRGAQAVGGLWEGALELSSLLQVSPTPAPIAVQRQTARFEAAGSILLPPPKLRLWLFAGKGGVGKTTIACAAAVAVSQKLGRGTLIVSTDPAHSLADCLGLEVGARPKQITSRLWALELDAEKEFAAFRDLYRQEVEQFLSAIIPGLDLTFDQEAMYGLLDLAPPGLDEVMALIRISEQLEGGKFDLLVLDTAPTGHLLRLLELPQIIEQWIQAVFGVILKFETVLRMPKVSAELVRVSRGIKNLRALLHDPRKCRLLPVTIPTEMALAETSRLVASARRLGIEVGGLILNQVAPPGSSEFERTLHESDAALVRKFTQQFPEMPPTLVYRRDEPIGFAKLLQLGELLFEQMAKARVA